MGSDPAGAAAKKRRSGTFRGIICLLIKPGRKARPAVNIIIQKAIEMLVEIIKTIEENGLSNIGQAAKTLFGNIVKGTLEIISSAISEVDNVVLTAKKERKLTMFLAVAPSHTTEAANVLGRPGREREVGKANVAAFSVGDVHVFILLMIL